MKIAVQVDDINRLDQASKSICNNIRFGSEFCEWKLPELQDLEKACDIVENSGKTLTYVTPRVSNTNLQKIDTQLSFLNDRSLYHIVINDLGILGLLSRYQRLKPHLGRQLVYMPARSPWRQITAVEVDFWTKRRVERVFYQTGLNYSRTREFFGKLGVRNIDVDWIPKSLPYFDSLIEQGVTPSVYLYLVLVTLTRKCHTARFLGEKIPQACSRRCHTKAFLLKQKALDVELYLIGNTIYRQTEPSKEDLRRLVRKEAEMVVEVNPVTKLYTAESINQLIDELQD